MNQRLLRQWHGYVGAFIAPSVLFFALTGALQLFDLHEAHAGYQPAPLLERLGRLHKDQLFSLGGHHHRPPSPAARRDAAGRAGDATRHGDDHGDADDRPATSTVLLKLFFLAVALGLALSTALGIGIALTRPRGRAATLAALLVGAAVPLVLLAV